MKILVPILLLLVLLSGCASADFRFTAERYGYGLEKRTPPHVKVEKTEFFSGQTVVVGQGVWQSGGVGGTLSGHEIRPDGKVGPVHKRVP